MQCSVKFWLFVSVFYAKRGPFGRQGIQISSCMLSLPFHTDNRE